MIIAVDTETWLIRPGETAPRLICASVADDTGARLYVGRDAAVEAFRALLLTEHTLAFANAAYDLAVFAEADATLLPGIFRALREGRIYDVLIAQALDAIAAGTLGQMPGGGPLVDPSTGRESKRYSLAITTFLVLGRTDAKKNDVWRKSYALLDGVPESDWPEVARQYPLDDVINTREVALAQVSGRPGSHAWKTLPRIPGDTDFLDVDVCEFCEKVDEGFDNSPCPKAPPTPPHGNASNHTAQVEAAFALHLGAAWGLRTDGERVEALAVEVEKKHEIAVERFQKLGWIRADGTEDQAAVKRAIALAYGATGLCGRCGGLGKIRPTMTIDCRGEKVKGRYQGCGETKRELAGMMAGATFCAPPCAVCAGTKVLEVPGSEVTCKASDDGCDGTGLDLRSVRIERTDKGGIKADRDIKMESGDDNLSDYGEDEFEKSRTTYVPALRLGAETPLSWGVDSIKDTGRISYYGTVLHQIPRAGRERECVRPRGAWCGSPVEYYLGSTDYEAGELVTLSALCEFLFGESAMRDAIAASGKPGVLHSVLAAEVLGLPLDDFLKRLKAKDKTAVDFRQMCKPINFGKGGAMGDAKLVWTSRKKNAGFTLGERGLAVNEKGEPGWWGVRFCILMGNAKVCGERKITEWKRHSCPPVCEACVNAVAGNLTPAYFRRYPEVKTYHNWVQKKLDRHEPAPTAIWSAEEGGPVIIRERMCEDMSAFANNGFQSMLSDISKDAYTTATRECYLGVKDDGSPSPLAGCRLPLMMHDEILSELVADTAHLSGSRIGEIMVASGERMVPGVWRAETALGRYWTKSLEAVYVDGKLAPWEPKQKSS